MVTLNPLDKASVVTLSNNNLTTSIGGSGKIVSSIRATESKSSGKWYWECDINTVGACSVGIMSPNGVLSGAAYGGNGLVRSFTHHPYKTNGSVNTNYGKAFTTGSTISVLLDKDNNTIEFWYNGESQNVAYSDLSSLSEVYAYVGGQGANMTVNFGATPFKYEIPYEYLSYDGSQNGTHKRILLKSNNKIYSLQSKEEKHDLKMTSNTTPAPYVASASSQYNNSYSAWAAFDGNSSTDTNYWSTTQAGMLNSWLMIKLDSPKRFNSVLIHPMSESRVGYHPKHFKIQASNDGVYFTELIEVNEVWNKTEKKRVIFSNLNKYLYYRIYIIENNGASYTGIREMEFSFINILTELPSNSLSNFIEYGEVFTEDFNLVRNSKHYILQDKVSEDTDGLWKQALSRKPLSIKFE